ncbi:hypothetical protein DSOUD_3229 [Desulfuromonas soudanensis]|uniref:Outer membrane protein beta-barrel domain-containing protein n=1 Tax=Desulfuromonas soudanensis TaxID=1603606 RepID=A0A0M3QGG8_9BACT|nr:hypothetical protein [Desulfuromonas soudanensis]ALC17949.1 hypothetical protein DSOUD_3229 [Desulfuromonas soudanensis]
MGQNSTYWMGLLFFTLLTALPAFGAGNSSCPLPPTSSPALHYDRIEIPSLEGAPGTVAEPDTSPFTDLKVPDAPPAPPVVGSTPKTKGVSLRFETASPFTPYLGAAIGPSAADATPAGRPDSAPPENLEQSSAYLLSAGIACDLNRGARLNLGYRYATHSLPELANPLGLDSDPAGDDHHISVGLKLAF